MPLRRPALRVYRHTGIGEIIPVGQTEIHSLFFQYTANGLKKLLFRQEGGEKGVQECHFFVQRPRKPLPAKFQPKLGIVKGGRSKLW